MMLQYGGLFGLGRVGGQYRFDAGVDQSLYNLSASHPFRIVLQVFGPQSIDPGKRLFLQSPSNLNHSVFLGDVQKMKTNGE